MASGYASIVLDRIARQARQIVDADGSCLVVRDRRVPGTTIAVAGCGRNAEIVGDRVVGDVLLAGVLDSGRPARTYPGADGRAGSEDQRARVAVPVHSDGEVCGALAVDATRRRSFGDRELTVLADVAVLAGAAVGHATERAEARPRVRPGVLALIEAIDARDGYTADHSQTVVQLSRALGERLDLNTPDLLELELAALFHDIGKVAVPDAILQKPTALDHDEGMLMRRHPEWGAAMLAGVPGLEVVATIVRCHHERWGGTGYPNGLAGERIPMASRLVAACDAYDAMTSDRPYRKALPPGRAREQLRAGAGSQFDPAVVELVLAVLSERDGGYWRERFSPAGSF